MTPVSPPPPGPRILCLVNELPWPPSSGYRQRIANVVQGLTAVGSVDLFLVPEAAPTGRVEVPAAWGVHRWHVVPRGPVLRGAAYAAAIARSRWPRRMVRQSWVDARRELAGWAQPPYDLTWCSQADTVALLPAGPGPTVVDLVDLEDEKLRHRRRAVHRPRWPTTVASARRSARAAASRALDRLDERRWAALQSRIVEHADLVVVTSELDRQRLGRAEVAVAVNGYDRPGAPDDAASAPPDHPVLLMVGLFTYEPNADGARSFLADAWPRIRAAVPSAELRLVGRHDGALDDVATRGGVTVTGAVDDLGPELARATLSVAPIRFGGGTRIKVLEAFANRIPVVATSVGCEGLGVGDGRELLVADDGDALAAACLRLVGDDDLCRRLVERAYAHWHEHHRWVDVRATVGRLALHTAAAARRR